MMHITLMLYMPFIQEVPQGENYEKLQRRQIVVWSFLIFMMLTSVSALLYISYQVMKGKDQGSSLSTGNAPIMTPISKIVSGSSIPSDNHYILYGQYSAQDSKYHLYKIFYRTFAKQEFFSFLWRDGSSQPSFAFYGNDIAVFPDVNKGFLVSPEGKMVIAPKDFIPPDSHFSISPDKKHMFYFTYLSSIGTTSLTLRDLEKGKDIFKWPVSSSASQVCDFAGWSDNDAKAYCLAKDKGVAMLKSFDAISHAVNTIVSKKGIADAAYYPQLQSLLAVSGNTISIYNQTSGIWRNIVSAPVGSSFENAFLVPDGSGVVYTQHRTNNIVSDQKIYFIALDGSGRHEVLTNRSARLVSISPDSQTALFESFDKTAKFVEHYSIARIDGSSATDLYLTGAPVSGTQFIGWSK